MSKITRANIAAARAHRDVLRRRGQEVPARIERLADLDPDRLPAGSASANVTESEQSHVESGVVAIAGPWALPADLWKRHSRSSDREMFMSFGSLAHGAFFPHEQLIDGEIRLVVVDKDTMGAAEEYIHGSSEVVKEQADKA